MWKGHGGVRSAAGAPDGAPLEPFRPPAADAAFPANGGGRRSPVPPARAGRPRTGAPAIDAGTLVDRRSGGRPMHPTTRPWQAFHNFGPKVTAAVRRKARAFSTQERSLVHPARVFGRAPPPVPTASTRKAGALFDAARRWRGSPSGPASATGPRRLAPKSAQGRRPWQRGPIRSDPGDPIVPRTCGKSIRHAQGELPAAAW
jgi:hypothetical protein